MNTKMHVNHMNWWWKINLGLQNYQDYNVVDIGHRQQFIPTNKNIGRNQSISGINITYVMVNPFGTDTRHVIISKNLQKIITI